MWKAFTIRPSRRILKYEESLNSLVMDFWTLVVLLVFGAVSIISLLLLRGAILLIREQERKMGIFLASYKSDLEMTLLNVHNFDEFLKQTEAAMKGEEGHKEPADTAAYH